MSAALNLVYLTAIWALFLLGVIVRDAWVAAPAAFLILLETLCDDARRP